MKVSSNLKFDKGFTLVELLVAISIVAVLATIGFTLFQTTQASARDAKRRADVDAMATALETHFDPATGVYADLDDSWFTDKVKPVDPLNSGEYVYTVDMGSDNTSYKVCAQLERGGGNFTDRGNTSGSGNYYCKLNQQS